MFIMCGKCEPCFTAASNMAPVFCFPAAKWGLVGTTTACISSVLMKGCKCLMACASIRSKADAIYMALDNRVSHGGYSVWGKLRLIILYSSCYKWISSTKGIVQMDLLCYLMHSIQHFPASFISNQLLWRYRSQCAFVAMIVCIPLYPIYQHI